MHNGGMILDDPVSSLDDQRKGHIARRLIEEASSRQVIVFTHDLGFVTDLQSLAEWAGVPCAARCLWRTADVAGLVDTEPPFDRLRFTKRLGKLKQEVQQWDSRPSPTTEDEK